MTTRIDPRSATYQRNAAAYAALIDQLRERMTWSLAGGGEKLRARHLDRGKVPTRSGVPGRPTVTARAGGLLVGISRAITAAG